MRPSGLVIKSADESRASTATAAIDSDLQFTAVANTWYRVDLYFLCYAATTPDFRFAWSAPSNNFFAGMFAGSSTVEPIPVINQEVVTDVQGATNLLMPGSATSTDRGVVRMYGLGRGGASNQTWGLLWAQVTSNITAATVFAGSWLAYEVVT